MTNQQAIEVLQDMLLDYSYASHKAEVEEAVNLAVKALEQEEPKWIPFTSRPLTEEEREEYPEWDCILDCKLPDDGQRILVNIKYKGHEAVQMDEYYNDDGSYLDSGYEICSEANAWMPLPEPYRGEGEK